jgi:uncharacterized protein (TIGR02646 family)
VADVRIRADAPQALLDVTTAQHDYLASQGLAIDKYWSKQPPQDAAVFGAFKSEVKNHYFWAQGGRCCYCSIELHKSKRSWDLEHMLDQSTHKKFMFALKNLAAACPSCNLYKRDTFPLTDGWKDAEIEDIPYQSADYVLIHPHLDEWDDYLQFDPIGRIEARQGSGKGIRTIEICGISRLNRTRLAMAFGRFGADAEEAMRELDATDDPTTKQEKLSFLKQLAATTGNASATAIVDVLSAADSDNPQA